MTGQREHEAREIPRSGSSGLVRSATLRVLQKAIDVAAADPDWRGGPAEYDYLSAEQIAELVGLDPAWQTLGYAKPTPATVLRQLRQLEHAERVWGWEAGTRGTAAVARLRWALIPGQEQVQP